MALFARDLFLWIRPVTGKAAFVVAFLAVGVGVFAGVFLPGARSLNSALGPIAPQPLYPRVRTDLQQVSGLLDALNDRSRQPNSAIYILSSSFTLNSSIAREACASLDPPHRGLASKISQTNDIDKRDGFPDQMLKATLVVLTVPVRLPSRASRPASHRNFGGTARAWRRRRKVVRKTALRISVLEDGSSAFIYQKVRPLDPVAVRALSDQFLSFTRTTRISSNSRNKRFVRRAHCSQAFTSAEYPWSRVCFFRD